MSSIEEQLARDIAAVMGGVVVTDSDVREARSAVDEAIITVHRRDRRRTFRAVAAAVVVVAGGVAALLTAGHDHGTVRPAGPPKPVVNPDAAWLTGAAPTPQLVQGVWRLDNGDALLQYDANGTMRFSQRGSLFAKPDATGTFSIKGDEITMVNTRHTISACADAQSRMLATLADAGRMNFVRGADESGCGPVPSNFARGTWEQVLPTSRDWTGTRFPKSSRFEPLKDMFNLYGVLLPQVSGYLVEVDRGHTDRDGSYYVADESGAVVDRGHWTMRHSDLTFTSGAGSTACSQGDRLVLAGVDNEVGLKGIRGTVQQDQCRGGWGASAWFTIAHRSFD
jgi:hypothetical protein